MRVATVGCSDRVVGSLDESLCAFPAADLAAAIASPAIVVILGLHVFTRSDPRDVARELEDFGGVVIGAVPRRMRAWDGAWADVRVIVPRSTADVPDAVERAVNARPLRRLSVRAWLGQRLDAISGRSRRCVRLLPALSIVTAKTWAQRLTLTERTLYNVLAPELGAGPGTLARRYSLECARDLRSRGAQMATIARVLGGRNRSALSRAVGPSGRNRRS